MLAKMTTKKVVRSRIIFINQQYLLDQKMLSKSNSKRLPIMIQIIKLKRFYIIVIMNNLSNDLESNSHKKAKLDKQKEDSPPSKNHLQEFFKQILPPFVVTIIAFLFRMIFKIFSFIFSLFKSKGDKPGQTSAEFNKREFEPNIESVKIKQQQLGFTNQVLVQDNSKTINFFLPVYITNKIKSIQDISIQSLTGNVSCALIINVHYGEIPQEIIKKLESSILVQLNRGEAMLLADDGITITVKRDKKARFIIFTIRKVFLAFLIEDTLWSPFEMIRLILSLTLNTVAIAPYSLDLIEPKTGYCPQKQYKISFNCMRNSDLIPMSFAMDCVYGVYDLAERRMEAYHSNLGTYKEIQRAFEEGLAKKSKRAQNQRGDTSIKLQKKGQKNKPKQSPKPQQENFEIKNSNDAFAFLNTISRVTIRRLSMRTIPNENKKPPKKVKYFQYTHFVIPLYKYPGNSLITIFLPILLLALLSLAIFFQESELSGRIGAIATMILGYIALIPSIKQQLPPSSKLTVTEALVYIETLCCLLCLYESFSVRDVEDYEFIWYENLIFLACLIIHSGTFIFILMLYAFHKLKWEKQYNCDHKVVEIKPAENPQSWDNPYCDQVFVKYNNEIIEKQNKNIDEMLIKVYKNPYQNPNNKLKIQKQPKLNIEPVSLHDFPDLKAEDMMSSTIISRKKLNQLKQNNELKPSTWHPLPMSPRSAGEFVAPDQNLYYENKL